MSLVMVETLADIPLTPEEPTDTDLQVLDCLMERNGTWRYSLLSVDRRRMICTFEAPDAESVRAAYRKGGGGFHHIWSAQLILPAGRQPPQNDTILNVLEGTYPSHFIPNKWDEAKQHILLHYAECGVEWVQSYMSLDRTRVVCELNAPSAEVIRETYHKVDMPFDRVWSAMVIKP